MSRASASEHDTGFHEAHDAFLANEMATMVGLLGCLEGKGQVITIEAMDAKR